MDNLLKYTSGVAVSAVGFFAPISTMIVVVAVFIAIDFITGVWASAVRARRKGVPWCFSSRKAWNTIIKLVFVMGGVVLTWVLDEFVLIGLNLHLSRIFTGFVCGIELWSYLENAAEISNHPIFRWLNKWVLNKIEEKTGVDIDGSEDKKGDK